MRKVTLENGKVVDNDMLFTKWNGEPMDPDIISSWFPKFLETHDLPDVNFHSLRHSNASILIAAHVPITTVSGRLGHAQTSTTLNYYASALQLGTHLLHKEGVVRAIGRRCPWWSGYEQPCGAFQFHCKRPHTPALVGMQGVFMI